MDIRNRWNRVAIASSKDGESMRDAVIRIVSERTNLRAANLRAADLRAADLRAANLGDADLRDADLRDANLRDADLRAANLGAADLRAANLRAANLRAANLGAANLRAANLGGANLSGADLSGADLSGANLSGADLRDADLRAKQYICRIQGRRHEINVINGDVRIGCIRKPLAEWLTCYEEVGAENGYTPFEIAEYGACLRHIETVLKLWATATDNVDRVAEAL